MEFAVAHCLKITKNVSNLIFNTFVMIQAFSILNETFSLIFKHHVYVVSNRKKDLKKLSIISKKIIFNLFPDH